MSRISEVFTKAAGKPQFIAYVCALDPDYDTSLNICRTLIEAGVDILELGVPFSDPLADGKTNQLAAERALAAGGTPDQVLDLVKDIRKFSEVPVVLYTYFNLVYNKGEDSYIEQAQQAGVDGILVLDLPPEESKEVNTACKRHGVDQIFLIAPTTPEARIPTITKDASGFIYYVSREGVTGERSDVAADIGTRVEAIRKTTSLPIGIGFGISNADQVRQIAKHGDAVIVGSSIVKIIEKHANDTVGMLEALEEKIRSMRKGLE